MKKIIYFILTFVSLYFYACSKESNPTENAENPNKASLFYPGNNGTTITYDVVFSKIVGPDIMGNRIISFTGMQKIEGTDYFIQHTKTEYINDTTDETSYFRRTDNGVYFFVDTTGLSTYFPDSLKSLLTVEIDKELILFSSNLDKNNPWKAYKMNVKYGNIYNFTIIDLSAHYQGSEDIELNLTNGNTTKKSEHIKYKLSLFYPNLSDPSQSKSGNFEADGWFVKDVGLVKLQGNLTVANALTGGGIDFDDTTRTVTQSIKAFDLKKKN